MKKFARFLGRSSAVGRRETHALFHNFHTVLLLLLAGIGMSTLLSELPYVIPLPLWIEAPLIAPAVAALVVLGLATLAVMLEGRTE